MTTATQSVGARGSLEARLRDPLLVGLFAGAFLALVGLAALALALRSPGAPVSCPDGGLCGGPPRGAPPLVVGRSWRSAALGYGLEYDEASWRLVSEDAVGIQLLHEEDAGSISLSVRGTRGLEPAVLLDETVRRLQADPLLVGLAADTVGYRATRGPSIGYVDGVGADLAGTTGAPQGSQQPVTAAVMAARAGAVTLVATATATVAYQFSESDPGSEVNAEKIRRFLLTYADSVLNSVQWPRAAAATTAVRRWVPRQPLDRASGWVTAPADPAATVDFTLTLVVPGKRALERRLEAIYNPRSPEYRRFATPAEIGRRFGLSDGAIRRVETRLRAGGIEVVRGYPQRTALRVQGSVRSVEELFAVELVDVRGPSGTYRAPLRRPAIPPELEATVAAVTGLDTRPALRPAAVPAEGMKPRDVAKAYEIERLHARGLHGEGQTVAILSFDSFRPDDVAAFDLHTGVTGPPVEIVPVAGGTTVGTGTIEVNLDIDIVRAIAPQAQILDYEAPNTFANFAELVRQVVADQRADIVSVSWGACLPQWPADAREELGGELQNAAMTGITVFVATGDGGAYDCEHLEPLNSAFTVDWPAASPHVVAVGGTRLSVRRDGTYLEEAGWEDVLSHGGGGGGINPIHPRPEWQRAPGVDNPLSTGTRQVPDVAAAADCDSAFFIVYSEAGGTRHVGPEGCGTSAAAPFWAGVTALMVQLAEQEGVGRLGFLNPTLYALARTARRSQLFHDVTRGGNRFHNAGPGWDYATGLGSPRVDPLARAIVTHLRGTGG